MDVDTDHAMRCELVKLSRSALPTAAEVRRARMNRLLSYVADGLGTSSWLWKFKHNVLHHGATNIEGVDSDIAQAPFARLAPGQPWRSWHRHQHSYLWPLYGFFALKNPIFGDIRNLASGHLGAFVVVPILFNPWLAVVAFYLSLSWLVGFMLAVTFQLAHCVEGMAFEDESAPHRGQDFVERHLAPRLPHTVYRTVGRRFRAACEDLGVAYHSLPGIVAALRSHARWLRPMGQPMSSGLSTG
ncbi:MAG: fatty acid desaturase [Acidimicrobiia bacterium]|nr:fatty acid desaturase [Acidimicrobiia bacterium]